MKFVKQICLITIVLIFCCLISINAWAAGAKKTLVFNDRSWDSIQVHNRIAGYILKHGYGYNVEYMFSESVASLTGLGKGDIDVLMEMWVQSNIAGYKK